MKQRFLFFICLFFFFSLGAQTPLINDLQKKHKDLQKQIVMTEKMLRTTKKNVQGQLNHLAALNGQIEERKRYIESMNNDVKSIEGEVSTLSSRLRILENSLRDKQQKYINSVYYLYRNKTIQDKLMFIFSAKSLSQMYRRIRYVKEYATYQRLQGEEIQRQQAIVTGHRIQLVQVKQVKVGIVHEREGEKAVLVKQEQEKQIAVADLQKKQRGLQSVIAKKRNEANQLNARIDRLITIEIEKARRRAEEEARKRREEEARRMAEEAARKRAVDRENAASGRKGKSSTARTVTDTSTPKVDKEDYISSVDRRLSTTFAGNQGRLPVPVTGPYIIISHYGQYAVDGMKNVKLDNKGIDIQAHPGASARAIFDGEVSAVFQLNGLINILVRHGEYISVYCNLSSSSVSQGQKVSTRQPLGRIASDASDGGRTVLHFQLRKERSKLNPEQWLGR